MHEGNGEGQAEGGTLELVFKTIERVFKATIDTVLLTVEKAGGGEWDGATGILRHARDKSHVMFNRTLALLSLPAVNQAAVQHWAGKFCFAAGVCRPCFSVVQGICQFIASFDDTIHQTLVMPPSVIDVILVGVLFWR